MWTRGKPIKSVDKFCRWIKAGRPICYNNDLQKPTIWYTAEEANRIGAFTEIVDAIRCCHWFEVIEK